MAEHPAYVVDGDASSWRSGHVEAATVLWERAVPVKVQAAEREERTQELSVRILLGVAKHQHNSKVLRVQVTSEDDPFFLHTLEVTEEDFQSLKVEQCILVDFATFPSKFIELVEECVAAGASETPRFTAVLNAPAGGGDSVFSVVETNQFKNLSHIALRFRPGNDAAIKQYLAERLFEVKGDRASLRGKLADTEASLSSSRAQYERASASFAELEQSKVKLETEMNAAQMSLLADAKQKALAELETTKKNLEDERASAEAQYRSTIDSLTKRNDDLDAQARQLMDAKFALEGKLTETSAKLGSTSGELDVARKELQRLRDANRELDGTRHEREKDINAKAIRISGLEQQVADKDELLQVTRERLDAAETYKATVEGTLGETKAALQRTEEREQALSAEVRKGNEIIERLQAELRSGKAKQKLKAAVITQQENLLSERQGAIEKGQREAGELRREVDALQAENAALKGKVADQESKLEESQSLLQSNQQMIQWLNQQVNEAQLGKLGASSRYMFRPSVPLTSAPASTSAAPSSTYQPVTTTDYSSGVPESSQVKFQPPKSVPVGGT